MNHIELHISRAGHPDRKISLQPGILHIGRAEDNDIVLADVSVSRRHARLEVTTEGIVVEDLGSGNGSFFAGKRIERQVLGHGDVLSLEPFSLRVEFVGQGVGDVTDAGDQTVQAPGELPLARLTIVSNHKMQQRDFPLQPGQPLTIGRSERNAIVLPEPASSRAHAELNHGPDGWALRDMGSSNGTFVNSRRVKEKRLEEGDRIRIGTVEMRFTMAARERTDGTEAYNEALLQHRESLPPPPPVPQTTSFLVPAQRSEFLVANQGSERPTLPPTALPPEYHEQPATYATLPLPAHAGEPAGVSELQIDPDRAPRARSLSKGARRRSTGFFSRPINQASLGIVAITFVLVGGKVASEMLTAFTRSSAPAVATASAPPPLAPAPSTPSLATPALSTPSLSTPALSTPALSTATASGGPSSAVPPTASAGATPAVPGGSAPSPAPASSGTASANVLPLDAAAQATVDAGMAEGMKSFSESRYFDAAAAFYRVLQVAPAHRDARRMGYVACEFITFAEVRSALVARTTTDATKAEAKSKALAAVGLAQTGDLPVANARELVEAALALAPADVELVAAVETLNTREAQVARAVSAGRAEARTRSLDSMLTQGQSELERSQYAKAVRSFEGVLAADPSRASPQYYAAEEGIRTAKDRMKADSKTAWSEANTAMKAGDWVTARARLRQVLTVDPFNESASIKLAEAQKRLREQASEVYKEARVMEEIQQTDKALAAYQKVLRYVDDAKDPLAQKAQQRMDALLR